MERNPHFFSIFHTLRHIFSHIGVTLLAVGVAFSLPALAKFILFTWWPMVEGDSQLLLINESSCRSAGTAVQPVQCTARAS
jgi:hypothetical protein